MIDYNVEVKKEFNKHHNLAKVQEKFPQLKPASIVHYVLDTTVCQYTSKPDKDESKIKTLDLTNIKPNITPNSITNYTLDTTISKNRTRYGESSIKKLDITTDIKPITISDIIAKKEDVNELSFIANDEPYKNFTGRKTINYQELFYMVLIEGRPLGYLMNVFTCNEYSILKGLQFLHAEARDEVIKAKIIEYSNIYFFKA